MDAYMDTKTTVIMDILIIGWLKKLKNFVYLPEL